MVSNVNWNRFLGIVAVLSFVICPVEVSGQADKVFSVSYPACYQAVNDFVGAGVSAEADLPRVAELMNAARLRNRPKDIRNIQRAELVVKQMWGLDTATFQSRAMALMRQAEEAEDHAVVGFVFETLGDDCYVRKEYVKAFEFYLRAYDYYHNRYRAEFPDMTETQLNLAKGYFRFGDYTNVLRYSRGIVDYNDPKRAWISILLNDLVGSSYLAMGMPDSAITYFQRIATFVPLYHRIEGRTIWRGVANGKIGLALFQQKKYNLAIPFLQQGVDSCLFSGDAENAAHFSLCLYRIFRVQSDIRQMDKYLEVARTEVFRANNLETFIDYYELMSGVRRTEGNAAKALLYMDSALSFRDSLSEIVNVNKKYVAELGIMQEHRVAADKAAKAEKSRLVATRNTLVMLAVSLVLLILFLYNRSLLKQRLHRQELLAEKKISEAELRSAVAQLDVIRKSLSDRNELVLQLETSVKTTHDTEVFLALQQSTILTEEQWEHYRALFERAHPGFLQRLKDKYPELSPAEIRFMVLARLDYSNKEMAATLGVSGQAIRTTWYRIRKKLQLVDDLKVEDFVSGI